MYTIRFHLGKGKHYGWYQVRKYITDAKQGEVVEYINPNTHSIVMVNCKTHNKINQATKIFNGSDKSPCAWLIFESYYVSDVIDATDNQLCYNPRVNPYWTMDNNNVDGHTFDVVTTNSNKLYI
jgi:hypothetical protein